MGCLISNFLKVKVFPERISDKMNHFLELKNVSKTIDGKAYKSYESANTYTTGTFDVVIVS